ncbi:hypothetical protein [Amycolatopsis samaneae]|uniref:Uncharacterized protein n=1 Tax=Amycolatopsis samaneae TaxID=664691 RepID=A0ABW5GXL3_9PSEU
MGWNSKTAHASYAVAPATAAGAETSPGTEDSSDYALHLTAVCGGETAPDTDAEAALAIIAMIAHSVDLAEPGEQPAIDLPEDREERYALLVDAVHDAQQAAEALDESEVYIAQLRQLCADYLANLTPEDLTELAAANGFDHPSLVGLPGESQDPLAHWLDPSYADDAESKKKIQALAHNRFAALCAGDTVGGMDLAHWQHTDPTLTASNSTSVPVGFSAWHATAETLAAAQSSLATTVDMIGTTPTGGTPSPEQVATLIGAENRIATAQNPHLAGDIGAAVAAARHQVDQLLTHVTAAELGPAIDNATSAGHIGETEPQVLGPQQMLKLLRASTPADERADLMALATQRGTALTSLAAATTTTQNALASAGGTLPDLTDTGAAATVKTVIDGTHQAAVTHADIATWDALTTAPTGDDVVATGKEAIASWVSTQKLSDLRTFVTDAGYLTAEQASVAGKSSLQSYLTQHAAGASDMAATIAGVLQQKHDTKHHTPVPAASPKPALDKTAGAPTGGGTSKPRSKFGAQHAAMLSALQHAKAAHSAVGQPLDAATVAAWDFGTGTPASLGGTQPKTLHTGPDGETWLAKRESVPRGGALTHTEAAASRMLTRAGLPAVPVYATTIDGKPAAVQPLLTGVTEMAATPSSWSQADVDAIVRLHVTSWALGNHDAHHGNVLRTGDGGLIPIDQGQSFKHFGRDTLSRGYQPSTSSVYDQAYDAHLNGTLKKGVTVNPAAAHAVIKKLESVPDAEWRAMLHTTAHTGATHKNLSWVAPMRSRAAKQHGIAESAVTTSQVADAFLDYAVERKKNLRRDFAAFFTGELNMPHAAALEQLGGP